MSVVKVFPAHSRMTVEQALGSLSHLELTKVLIVGYTLENNLVIRSSNMPRETALWLLEKAKLHALGVE